MSSQPYWTIAEFTTKLIGDKRRWRAYKARTRQLPATYRTAVKGLERYLLRLQSYADGGCCHELQLDLTASAGRH